MKTKAKLFLPLETHVDNIEAMAFAIALSNKLDYQIELLFEKPDEYAMDEHMTYQSIVDPKNEIMLYMLFLKGIYRTRVGWNATKNVKLKYSIGESLTDLIADKKVILNTKRLVLIGCK